ncbi:hypothetical protein GQ464_001750 [Rhodocaloribacter litoris]|uniref:hypothetical protein n=1 Tax=Rhodocaloribacter litoris TaxID=2558931 RepID=UPI00141FB9D3|nr:hypothetical protein [Rhodocaloribacter litoris]QXD15693.1 hypothetical protein GQ464_001750 [Rhodocaloribacter litoris]GIV61629.1 MAG: hypothetical protein KatS3mg044_0495 [Rhodothermaceae bacterium]
MADSDDRLIEFERLNALGKAVWLGGFAVRLLGNAVEAVLDRAADVVVEAERAFRQGLDPDIEEAKILEEYREERPRR